MPFKDRVDKRVAISYIKEFKDSLFLMKVNIFDSQFLYQDFNIMLNANVLILLHGTLSWWAGYLTIKEIPIKSLCIWSLHLNQIILCFQNINSDKWLKW